PDKTRIEILRGNRAAMVISARDGLRGTAMANSEQTGELVLVRAADGEGITEVDLAGKLVLVDATAGIPGGSGRRGRGRAMNALSQGIRQAGGQILAFVNDEVFEQTGPMGARSAPGGGRGGRVARGRSMRPSQLIINSLSLNGILQAANLSPEAIEKADGPVISLGGLKARSTIEIATSDAPAFNVLGILPGSDPKLRDEFVAIGCHLDHLGRRGDTIYPGADDDGSGSVGLMAISQAFAKNENRPKRSIIFMAFCGEEMGLRGSRFLAENSPVPLENIVAELQIDMIGRNEESGEEKAEDNVNSVHLVGTEKLSSDLHDLCLKLNEERAGLDFEYDEEDVFYRSDHFSFAREGIPIAFLFTGFHPDYHKPTDTVEKINFDKLARIATYVYDLAYELADQDSRPMVDADRWQKMERKGRQTPVAPVRKAAERKN
ncbi:MAG: M28 family metallopeptidase, partial [Planctomycetota bacterium]